MKFKIVLSLIVLAFSVSANFAQNDIQIKKKSSRTIPGMREGLSPAMEKQLREMNNTTSTVYLKNSQMRTDNIMKLPNKTGSGFQPVTYSLVVQCNKQRVVSFNSKDKKYYQYSMSGQSSLVGKTAKSGGSVTISGSVTDTGERAKIFGYEAKRLKQTIIFTPGAKACLKEKMQIEIDGWYADIPEFSCPMKATVPDDTTGGDCLDDYDYQIKGAVTGVALKEIKKIYVDGQLQSTLEEEATEVSKTTLADSFFEPPVGYIAANSINNSPENNAKTTPVTTPPSSPGNPDSLSLPSAGVAKTPLTNKKANVVRIGIAKPKVTTPESKKDPEAGSEVANAVTNSLAEFLKSEKVETIQLETDFPENECKEKGCDYIFYANVTQKRGGGGMFKSMILQGAIVGAGMMVPGVGGMIASTVASQVMGKTMGKMAKAKDEFALDYKVLALDKTILSQATTKKKTEKDGEDVLTPQLQEASKTVLGEIARKENK
jgi:hypothetical protein